MLKVGDKLPQFEGTNQDGETVHSENLIGKKLVVFFYPKANTPGCTAEACNLRDNYSELKKQGFELLGVSADPVKNQKKFSEKFEFPFDIIADETRDIIEKFGVWQLKKFMGKEFMGIVRTTFVFDENGICTEVIDKVKTKDHAAQILK
ncbi:thioredoxin-dependent thiol peroxidase [Chryseobacterium gambrini]|uniref:thioredoxin-dependent peroxiredoxin n=1 Tax=Chryseobacterium gambrini TaxID=373672 RepID=A0AAJ1R4J5_9FLAO|nr:MULTISPECIES: thioredoxin-dependent thiol peroxidase [Chryseobacterium]MDN4012189.1 thioredoxin-dependent thiol peroxidase [Chryseobacterium gambrini]MDN4031409.1 thioredoxin-dependent thiol peroxidase [Chryseobacterium gambrini]QWA36937.1 thioredoxin-dependent thiol peroxidase [Chryseobacterium sp. ZHDP1]